jgi:selenocysteine-specific elongation factor
MPLIGTAGHVDHGKSTLIQALTGRDPDRWDEEKRRGLTIDLGFAWTTLDDVTEVSFVDVPGHERYLKNMLAGIEAIDVALFVVAADEGWMPQSEEHLAVLDLLGVTSGIVALTKIDMVDDDLVELATLEIDEKLTGTTLADSPVVPVSAKTGEGLDQVREALGTLVASVETTSRDRPRLWVDRSFSVTGAGTVVTGTLLDGALSVDDAVMVYPRGMSGRIRGIQSHERDHTQVEPGRRVALNLGAIDTSDVRRGDMIGKIDQWEDSSKAVVRIRPARYAEELDQRGAFQIHLGSAVQQVEIVGLDGDLAVLKLARPLPIAVGDRFILRDTGRKLVVAGGRILDPSPPRTSVALQLSANIDPDADVNQIATSLLDMRGLDSVSRLARQTAGGIADGVQADDWIVSHVNAERLAEKARDLVERWHEENPLRTGLQIATLAGHLGIPHEIAEILVDRSPELTRLGPDVSITGRQIEVPEEDEADWERARSVLETGLTVPLIEQLEINPELLHLKIRSGELIKVSEDLAFLPSQIEQIVGVIRSLPDGFTVADFRDAADLSRKYAVPILEWADREGVTIRRGDGRTAR